jgi:hypothetical protein
VALEKRLRDFTAKKLSRVSKKNWWKERLPNDVRERAEEALKSGENPNPWIISKPRKLIECLDFMDYPKIFRRTDNWRDVFERVFKDGDLLNLMFHQIRPIRSKIAHPAEMDIEEKSAFLDFCQKLHKMLK